MSWYCHPPWPQSQLQWYRRPHRKWSWERDGADEQMQSTCCCKMRPGLVLHEANTEPQTWATRRRHTQQEEGHLLGMRAAMLCGLPTARPTGGQLFRKRAIGDGVVDHVVYEANGLCSSAAQGACAVHRVMKNTHRSLLLYATQGIAST